MNLDQFDGIAWDFDGTLIDHPKSPLMQRYIKEHPEKSHVIITFRTHGWQNRIFDEMLSQYPDAPGYEHFDDVYNISDRAWTGFTKAQDERKMGRRSGALNPWELDHVHWKGLVCKLRNIPLLVDDRTSVVLPGCEKYDIVFCHPDNL